MGEELLDGDEGLLEGESTPHLPGFKTGTQVAPVEKLVHLRSAIWSSSRPQTMLPTLVQAEQPASPVKAFPDGQEGDWVRAMRYGASTPHFLGFLTGTQVRPVEKRVHLRSAIWSSSRPQTTLPSLEQVEHPASPVKSFPDGQEAYRLRAMRYGESTPHFLGSLTGTQVKPVEKRVHLRSAIWSSSRPQTMLPSLEQVEHPASPVKGFPESQVGFL